MMTVGFGILIGLVVLLVGATLLVTLLPNKDAPSGLGNGSN